MGAKVPSNPPPTLRCKVLLLGEHGVGKSSLVKVYQRLTGGIIEEACDDEVTCQLHSISDVVHGHKVQVLCMDSLNEEDFSLQRRLLSIQNTDICMVVIDMSECSGFEKVPEYIETLLRHHYSKTVYLVGNKLDLGKQAYKQVKHFLKLNPQLDIKYCAVSALTGDAVVELFHNAISLGVTPKVRWHCRQGLLFIYSNLMKEPEASPLIAEPPRPSLSNICELIPLTLKRMRGKPKKQVFPIERLSEKLLRCTAEFL
jgi:GTPase SAR1 family protein